MMMTSRPYPIPSAPSCCMYGTGQDTAAATGALITRSRNCTTASIAWRGRIRLICSICRCICRCRRCAAAAGLLLVHRRDGERQDEIPTGRGRRSVVSFGGHGLVLCAIDLCTHTCLCLLMPSLWWPAGSRRPYGVRIVRRFFVGLWPAGSHAKFRSRAQGQRGPKRGRSLARAAVADIVSFCAK